MTEPKNYYTLRIDLFFEALVKNYWLFIIISLFAGFGAFLYSLTIPPKFKSTVILFPSTSASISKSLLSNNGIIRENLLLFGEKEDADRLLQALKSDYLKNRVIERFNLIDHYNIDSTAKYPQTLISGHYKKNFEFKRAPYMGIEISVLDTKPELAAEMANYCAEILDTIMNTLSKSRALKSYSIVEAEYFALEKQIMNIRDSLELLGSYGLTEYESQSQALNSEYARAVIIGNNEAIKTIEKKLNVIEVYGARFMYFSRLLEFEIERYSLMRSKYAEAKVEAMEFIPYKYVVDTAMPSERKHSPSGKVYGIIGLFLGMIIASSIIIYKEFLLTKPKM